jgi:hypothetical protein
MGAKCYADDGDMSALTDSVIAMWEDVFPTMTAEDLRPITMVMYSAALLPTGIFLALQLGIDVDADADL